MTAKQPQQLNGKRTVLSKRRRLVTDDPDRRAREELHAAYKLVHDKCIEAHDAMQALIHAYMSFYSRPNQTWNNYLRDSSAPGMKTIIKRRKTLGNAVRDLQDVYKKIEWAAYRYGFWEPFQPEYSIDRLDNFSEKTRLGWRWLQRRIAAEVSATAEAEYAKKLATEARNAPAQATGAATATARIAAARKVHATDD